MRAVGLPCQEAKTHITGDPEMNHDRSVSRGRLTLGAALAAYLLVLGCTDPQPSPAWTLGGDGTVVPPTASPGDVFSLLEKPFEGSEVDAFTGGMRQCSVDGNAAIVCPLLGVRLRLDGNGVVRSVDAYPNVIGDYLQPYAGPLPHGIRSSDTRATLIGKLGRPDASDRDWDRFTINGRWVFIEYFASGSPKAGLISKVQVSRPR